MNPTPANPIIVASDLSKEADMALSRACQLSKRLGAPLMVLHVIDSGARDDLMQAEAQLQEQVARCPERQGVEARLSVQAGNPAQVIIAVAREENAALLVMGRHHRKRPERFVGTTLETVSRQATVPILLAAGETQAYRCALLALDFSAYASEALRVAAMLLDGGTLHALHVSNPPSEASASKAGKDFIAEQQRILELLLEDEQETLDMLGITRPEMKLLVESGEVRSRLEQTAERLRPDFVALGCHSRSGVEEALIGSLAKALMQNPPCDLLIAR